MESYSYLHLGEPEDPDRNVVCKYRVTTDLPMEKAADIRYSTTWAPG